MGEVLLGEQSAPVRRRVAIKRMRPELVHADAVARFDAERQALAWMDHPGIARLIDAGTTDDGRPYLAMEYVRGMPITAWADERRLTLNERCQLLAEVCDAIQHAHQKGVLHRDIKPSNVLVNEEGRPKVIDFGVAKALGGPLTAKPLETISGEVLGTPEYMSPEQAAGDVARVDTRSDVYALGVLLYELLVGELPFDSQGADSGGLLGVLRRIREVEPAIPSSRVSTLSGDAEGRAARRRTTKRRQAVELRGDLDWIVMKALAKEPERRYAMPQDLAVDLRCHLADEPVSAGPPSTLYRLRKFGRRHRAAVAAGSVAAVAVIGLAITLAVQAVRISAARDAAREAAARSAREAATAERVSDFLAGLFDGADPELTGGRELTARELLDRGRARLDRLDEEPAVRAALANVVGGVYVSIGVPDAARELVDSAIAILEADPSADREELARALHLRAILRDTFDGDPGAAELPARRAVQLWSDLGRPRMEAISRNVLAGTLWHQGRFDEAALQFEASIAAADASAGPASSVALDARTNLGSLFLTQGDFAAAERVYRKLVRIADAGADPDRDSGLGTTLHLLAIALHKQGRFDGALAAERRSLQIRERVFGADHWHVALSLNTLGDILRDRGDPAGAQPLQERALAIASATWEVHPDRFWIERSLAATEAALGDVATARGRLEAQLEALSGLSEPWAEAEVQAGLGRLALAAGESTAAVMRFEAALAAVGALDASSHPANPTVADWFGALVEALRSDGRPAEAAEREAQLARMRPAR